MAGSLIQSPILHVAYDVWPYWRQGWRSSTHAFWTCVNCNSINVASFCRRRRPQADILSCWW